MVIHYVISHSNGASMVLGLVSVHINRGLYISINAYIINNLWLTGLVLYMLLMGISFLGYLLAWGQM